MISALSFFERGAWSWGRGLLQREKIITLSSTFCKLKIGPGKQNGEKDNNGRTGDGSVKMGRKQALAPALRKLPPPSPADCRILLMLSTIPNPDAENQRCTWITIVL